MLEAYALLSSSAKLAGYLARILDMSAVIMRAPVLAFLRRIVESLVRSLFRLSLSFVIQRYRYENDEYCRETCIDFFQTPSLMRHFAGRLFREKPTQRGQIPDSSL